MQSEWSLIMQLVIKKPLFIEMLMFCFTVFCFLYLDSSIQKSVAGTHFHAIFFTKRNIATVICPSERRETINISIKLPIELGDLYYTFGSRVETDAISKVLNLKFRNLCLSKTIKHLICPCSFMPSFFFSHFFKQ